jgi:biotin carboxyl carrier protein
VTYDVAEVAGIWSILVGPPGGSRRSYEVTFSEGGGQLTVYVNGRPVAVDLPASASQSRRARAVRGAASVDTGGGPLLVRAPMPGRIVKVLVTVGEPVAPRQGLIVVEAMKMENELRAPRAGIVTEIRVAPGAPVEAHAVLVVIES